MNKVQNTITNAEREHAKEKILEVLSEEFEGTEITTIFAITLLKEVISDIEKVALNKIFICVTQSKANE